MKHVLVINILKRELDNLTTQILPIEEEITQLCYQVEELKSTQNQIIESIKELGANNAEPHDANSGTALG